MSDEILGEAARMVEATGGATYEECYAFSWNKARERLTVTMPPGYQDHIQIMPCDLEKLKKTLQC